VGSAAVGGNFTWAFNTNTNNPTKQKQNMETTKEPKGNQGRDQLGVVALLKLLGRRAQKKDQQHEGGVKRVREKEPRQKDYREDTRVRKSGSLRHG